ncbi:MAG: restriction endonuclease [Candidatus Accumulibacter propinquus]|jgi:restriction system protein
MARRNTSVIEDVFGIAAMLPWWVGSTLAVVAYVVLHRYASADVPTNVSPGQVGQMVVGQMTKVLAFYGQFIVPLLLLAGAAASFFGRRKREGLVRDAGGDKSGATLRALNWKDFELLVGEAFRMRGFSVVETGGGGSDGGIDLQLKKGSEVFLVQCKQWRAYKVSVNVVRELFGVMASQGATGGFVVTSGTFSADARSFVEGKNIELIDGSVLKAMIDRVRTARPEMVSAGRIPASLQTSAQTATSVPEPTCPRCGGPMMQRIAKQGSKTGSSFWGCTAFPKCRGIKAVE